MRRSLTKNERIRKRTDLRRLFSTARRIECPGLKLLYTPNQLEWNRAAFATVRGFRTAVQRNRAKRVCREAYRAVKSRLKSGFDLVFVIRPDHHRLEDRIRQILSLSDQAGLTR
jgi:ribonuclease P protein component